MKKCEFDRIGSLLSFVRRRRLSAAMVFGEADIRGLVGIESDNACLLVKPGATIVLYTDFRYAPMVRRVAPTLRVLDIKKLAKADLAGRVGVSHSISHSKFEQLRKAFRRVTFVDIRKDLDSLRAVKTEDEICKLRASEALNCEIWNDACKRFRAGMTELDMARIIKKMMIERGDGEAFDTIVCIGRNAAECHHVPDGTVWNGRDGVLVDMGVKLNGYCSDLTRNVLPKRRSPAFARAYDLVKAANRAAIAAAKPGMTCGKLDRVARKMIAAGGFGKCFGHSLGHGVGLEIHEAPSVRRRDETVLRPGMVVTIEPGIYLEGNFGIRIEDMILITADGCEALSGGAGIA